jgi:hypothetical protein
VGLPSRLIVRFGSMLLKNALPQITCCVGKVFSLFSGWVLPSGRGDLAWIAMPLRTRRAHPTCWWAE